MFEVGKKYIRKDLTGYGPYHCEFANERYVVFFTLTNNPFVIGAPQFHLYTEYIPPPKMVKRSGWVNVYRPDILGSVFSTKGDCDKVSNARNRVDCIEIHWEEPEC